MLTLTKASAEQIPALVGISKASFDSDITVGSPCEDGPPGYDSAEWHTEMLEQGHLFAAMDGETIVGGAVLFVDAAAPSFMYVGRIFIDPRFFRRGYGTELMRQVEALDPNVTMWCLDTPEWNRRTNSFYRKIGYTETKREDDMIYYQKGSL